MSKKSATFAARLKKHEKPPEPNHSTHSLNMTFIDKILARMHLSETKQKVIRNLFWAVTGKVVTLLGSLLVGIFVARYLGPEQYGLMNYVVSYVALFQVFASFGLDNIEIREESKCKGLGEKGRVPGAEANAILGTAFGLKLIFAAVTMVLVILTAWLFEADTFTKWMITLYSLSMIMQTFGVIRNYFTSIVWNEYIVKTEISRTVIGALIKVVLLLLKADLVWFIAATLFDTVLIAGGYLLSYRRQISSPRLWTFDTSTAKYLIKESFPLLLSGAAVIIYQRIDQVMIGNMIDKTSVGYFSVAGKFVEVLMFVPITITNTYMPIIAKAWKEDKELYKRQNQQFMNITVWSTVLCAVAVCLLSYPLIRFTFGEQYLPSIPILQVLAFKAVSVALSSVAGKMIVVEGLQKWTIIRDMIGCVTCVLLNYLLLPRFGVIAAAWIAIVSNLAAGYFSSLIISPYRHTFICQTKCLFLGWKDVATFAMQMLIKTKQQ